MMLRKGGTRKSQVTNIRAAASCTSIKRSFFSSFGPVLFRCRFCLSKRCNQWRSIGSFVSSCRSFAFASRLRFCAGAIHITSHAHMHHYAVPRCSCMGIHPPPPPPVVSPSRGGEGAPSARMAAEISHVNFCFCCCTFAFFAFRPCNFKVVHPPQIQPPPIPSPWGRRTGARPRASPGHQRRPVAATVLRWSPTSFGCSFSSSSWYHS